MKSESKKQMSERLVDRVGLNAGVYEQRVRSLSFKGFLRRCCAGATLDVEVDNATLGAEIFIHVIDNYVKRDDVNELSHLVPNSPVEAQLLPAVHATILLSDMMEIMLSLTNIAVGYVNKLGTWTFFFSSTIRIVCLLSSPAHLTNAVHEVRETLEMVDRRVDQPAKSKIQYVLETLKLMPKFSIYGVFSLGPHAFLPLLSTIITFAVVSFQDMKECLP
ncbi:hypothetical protein FHG87_001997 [Trinorchestia longiramus]|nr:hypothetical protein FHG87_001997 [Trinorchestia longiramus]